jgi:hypothetical protein
MFTAVGTEFAQLQPAGVVLFIFGSGVGSRLANGTGEMND